jgi:Tfp pilus assembly protein PilF
LGRRLETAPAPRAASLDALCQQGLELHRVGRLEEARACYKKVLQRDPKHSGALHLLGVMSVTQGQTELGATLLRRAVAADRAAAGAHSHLGAALVDLGRPMEALASLDRALSLQPNLASAHYNRGLAFTALERHGEALASYDLAARLDPRHAKAIANRGGALHALERPQEALASLDAAVALDPGLATAHYSRGVVLRDLKRHGEAVAANDRAIGLRPDYADAHFNRSLGLLTLGDLRAGFEAYRWRWERPEAPHCMSLLPFPLWEGESLAGKSIVVYCEQGFGDSLHFVRYLRPLSKLAGRVALIAPAPLVSLFRSIPGISVTSEFDGTPCDYHLPLLCLPRLFGTTLETIPGEVPYLAPDAAKVRDWASRLAHWSAAPKVGLVWAGEARIHNPLANAVDRRRSMRLTQLAPLARASCARFFSLQKGAPASQAPSPPEGMDLVDFTSELHDFEDTAALVENLDLVITVDTSVAHLVGALAKPVWILSRFDGCWRWLNDREDSPWYPTARVFHQRAPGAWDEVVERVAGELAGLAIDGRSSAAN